MGKEEVNSWITNYFGYKVFKNKYENSRLLAIEIPEAGRDMLMFPEVHDDKSVAIQEINRFKKTWIK